MTDYPIPTKQQVAASLGAQEGFGVIAAHPPMATGTLLWPTANQMRAVRFVPMVNRTVSGISVVTTVAATNDDACDVGIFSADGATLLRSAGATTGKMNATAGIQTLTFAGGTAALVAGTTYYVGFSYGAIGGTAATLVTVSLTNSSVPDVFGTTMGKRIMGNKNTAHPLAAPNTLSNGQSAVPLMALLG